MSLSLSHFFETKQKREKEKITWINLRHHYLRLGDRKGIKNNQVDDVSMYLDDVPVKIRHLNG
jgi:hypothetical protein